MNTLIRLLGEDAPLALSSLKIALTLAAAWAGLRLAGRLISAIKTRQLAQSHSVDDAKRTETLARALRYVLTVIITLVTGMLVLDQVGLPIAPILATAGVAGIAVGFGAQSLVKDFFNGFFILLENQIRVGDVVEAGGKAGLVEGVTLRYIQLRDYDGNVHFVPNGTISTVTNMSWEFAQSVIDVGISYGSDIDRALAEIRVVGEGMRADPAWAPRILGELDVAGVEKLGDSAVLLRCRFKVASLEQWNVRREFFRRVKYAFDAAGIAIPFPQLTLSMDKEAGLALQGGAG